MAWSEKEKQPFNVDESASDLEWDTKSWKVQGAINLQLGQNFEGRGWEKNLDWDTDAILNDLKENHVKIEDAEMMWYRWKKVHIELPSYRNFEWFNFDYFVSDDIFNKKDFEKEPELQEKSYSMSDVSKLLQAMNRYITEHQGTNDGDMDYENELKYWETEKYRCNAWDCLRAITWLDYFYWLSDKDVEWRKNSRVRWFYYGFNCHFDLYYDDYNVANLFLKLSD